MTRAREAELDALMARLSDGDRSAFDPLYVALHPRALRLAALRLGAPHAPDVAQSALMKVFAHASDFEAGRPCLPWFYAIVANEIRAAQRAVRETIPNPAAIAEDALVDEADAESLLVAREVERALELATAALDGDAAKAIAALLGRAPMPDVPPATFRKRVSRAYAKLRLLLGGHDAL